MKNRRHQVQVSIVVRRPSNHTITRELLMQVLHYRATTGEDPVGFHVRMISWDAGKRHMDYEGDDVTDCLNSLFRAGWPITFNLQKVRQD